jgi:hypothetical protein
MGKDWRVVDNRIKYHLRVVVVQEERIEFRSFCFKQACLEISISMTATVTGYACTYTSRHRINESENQF